MPVRNSTPARAAASVLLVGAAVLMVAAAAQRWWSACPLGRFDTATCLPRQDHRYDYLFVQPPWTPLGDAAQLAGLGMVLLAGAAFLLPWLIGPDLMWPRRMLAWVPALSLVVVGVQTLLSGLAGRVVDVPLTGTAGFVWVLAWPLALIFWAGLDLSVGADWRSGSGFATAVLIGCSTPLPALVVLGPIIFNYGSYDTTPWTEAAMAPPLVLAALTLWVPVAARLGQRDSRTAVAAL